jgi:hypothetical protein
MLGFDALGRLALGQVATTVTYSLSVDPGSFTLNGQSANYVVSFMADAGSFTLNGQAVDLHAALVAAAGSFVLTGVDANFVSSYRKPLFTRGVSYWKGAR